MTVPSVMVPTGGSGMIGTTLQLRVARARRFNTVLLRLLVALLFVVPSTDSVRGLRSVGMPAQLLGWLALVAWLLGRVRRDGRLATGGQPVRWIVGVMIGGSLVSYGLAFSRPLVLLESGNADRLAFEVVAGAGIALLAADGTVDRAELKRLCSVLLGGAYFSAVVGLLQRFAGLDYNRVLSLTQIIVINSSNFGTAQFDTNIGRGFRAYGTADHAIEFAVVCSALLPLAIHAAFTAVDSRRKRRHAFGAAILAASALISISRSAVVGLLLGVLVYAYERRPRDLLNLSASVAIVLVAVQVVAHGVLSTLRYLVFAGEQDPSVAHRQGNAAYITPLLKHHQWVGIGFGTYQPFVYRFLDNEYYVMLVASGTLGMVAFALLFVAAATLARSGRRRYADFDERDLGQALAAGVLVLAVSAAFYDLLAFRQSAFLVFLLMGLAGAYWRLGRAGAAHPVVAPA